MNLGMNAKSIFVVSSLTIAALAFIVPGFFPAGISNLGTEAAKVGDEVVSMREFSMSYQRFASQFGGSLPEQFRSTYQKNILKTLVQQKIPVAEVKAMGFENSAEEVKYFIHSRYEEFQNEDGQFDPVKYNKAVKKKTVDPLSLTKQVEQNLSNRKFSTLFDVPFAMSKEELTKRWNINKTGYKLAYLDVTPSQEKLDTFKQQKRDELLEDPEKLKEIQKKYKEKKESQFAIPPKFTVKSLLLAHNELESTPGMPPPNLSEEAKKRNLQETEELAESIVADLKAGKDFAEYNEKYNDDMFSKAQKGILKERALSSFPVEARGDIEFAKAEDPVLGPFSTTQGVRVYVFESKTAKTYVPFEEAKKKIAEEMVQPQVDAKRKELENTLLQLAKTAPASQSQGGKKLKEHGVEWQKPLLSVRLDNPNISGLGDVQDILVDIVAKKNALGLLDKTYTIGGKKYAFEVLSVSEPEAPTAQELKDFAEQLSSEKVQQAREKTIDHLYSHYENNKKIILNPRIGTLEAR